MKIKTNTELKTLKGETLKNGESAYKVGDALSDFVLSAKDGGKMKLYSLAEKLVKGKDVEVDSADLLLIKKAVEEGDISPQFPSFNNLVAGQLLIMLENLK